MRKVLAGAVTSALVSAALASTPVFANASAATGHQATRPDPTKAAATAARLVRTRPGVVHASARERLIAHRVVTTAAGMQVVPYTRTYRGLPVVGGDFTVVTDAHGQVLGVNVAQPRTTSLASITPTIGSAAARRTSARQVSRAQVEPGTQLVVVQQRTSRLAWATTVRGVRNGEASRLTVYVDAHTGRVIHTVEHVMDGTGTGAYDGPNPLTIPTTLSSGTYSMTDPSNAITCQDASTNRTFTGTDDVWGNGVASNKETGCVDALFVEKTENAMLSDWDGRNGLDGAGHGWPIRIGLNDVNAYYDGTQVQIGHNQAGDWIPTLDVLGHEQGHGVDDHTPGGISGNGTQEFVADTFGAATEWYANEPSGYDTPDFTVGEEVNLVGSGPIRYMYDPSKAGDDNCYSSQTPTEEVHAAAGPGNHWFYLVAEGTSPTNGQPTSPTCNSSSVTGLGIKKAEQIMYGAMQMKTSSASYLKYRTWTLTAAKNLFPGSCAEFNTVKAAWNAVSVPAQTGDPTCTTGTNTVTVSNPGNQTGTVGTAKSLQMTATDSQAGQTLTWSATGLPAGESINASTGLISGTPTTAATSTVTVTAKDTTGATGSTSFTWTVSGTSGGGGSQLLLNPGFESGAVSWTGTSGPITNNTGRPAHSGTWKMWLGGNGTTASENESQTVTIPSSAAHATLTYWIRVDTSETTSTTKYDTAKVQVTSGGTTTTLASYSNLDANSTWVQKTIDLSSYVGSSVTLKFSMNEDSSLQTSFVVDDTALTTS
ncbi:MAG TPA: M4 family metallopeptidase [Nocardioides sp.]|nr:M4 family metallopeptidase [Nocardioides sp.]